MEYHGDEDYIDAEYRETQWQREVDSAEDWEIED